MRKKTIAFPLSLGKQLKRMFSKMILMAILISAGTIYVSAKSYSQETKINLNFRDSASFKDIFKSIEGSTEFIFIYDSKVLDKNEKRAIEIKGGSIEKVLDKLLQETNVTYVIDDRQVTIYEKPDIKTPPEKKAVSEPQQQRILTGTVTGTDKLPLPGVTVKLKGSAVGALTDMEGKFSIPVPEKDAILEFSFIGMTNQEIVIGPGNVYDVVLSENTIGLDEVVVVGYGIQKKESVVGAITQVNSATLMQSGSATVTNTIAGKLSGVLTIQQTGQPGNDQSEIIIRGLSSWNSSAPLVLIDGIERDFKNIDPNEINTVSILKDASATAVFGAKGANGVIIVTTKRGSIGKPNLNFSTSYGMEKATRIPDHISSYTTMSMLNVAKMNGQQFSTLFSENALNEYRHPSSLLNSLRYPDVNWFNELTKPFAPTLDANINVNGGTEFVKYFFSVGYLYQGGFFKGYDNGYTKTQYMYNRLNYRTNLDFTLTKTTQLSLNVGGDLGIRNQPGSTSWKSMYFTSGSRFPAYFPEWSLDLIPDPDYPDATGIRLAEAVGEHNGNPYSDLNRGNFNRYLDSKLFTDLILDQQLDFIIKGLSIKGKVALNTYYRHRILYSDFTFPQYQMYWEKIGKPGLNPWFRAGEVPEVWKQSPPDLNVGGIETGDQNNPGYYSDMYYELALNYKNTFGNHYVTGMALMNRQQKDILTEFPYFNAAVVGRGTYDYKHKYLFEMNIGYTGSERFAPGNRYGFFPAGAVGWVISEEPFFKNSISWINRLKIRYSDGLVGSDYAKNRWLYMSDYYKDGSGSIIEDKAPNPTAQWEEARKKDIGLELSLFNDALSFNVDFFDELRTNMLLTPRSVTPLVGNSFKDLNKGSMKKHGFEIEAEYKKTTARGLHYYVKGLFGFNENRVIFKDDLPYSPEYTKTAGKPLDAQLSGVLLTGSGYYTSINDIHINPAPMDLTNVYVGDYKYLDFTADGKISILDKYPIKGSTYPPITYSLSSGFNYKGFDFHFLFQGNAGKYVEFNQGYEWEFLFEDWKVHASQLDYWSPTNLDANHSTLHFTGAAPPILSWGGGGAQEGYLIRIEDRVWRNADYLRLKEVYAGYNFKPKFLNKLSRISNIQVYASSNNLWTITKLIEGDPERKDFTEGFYPQMTSVKFGCKVAF